MKKLSFVFAFVLLLISVSCRSQSQNSPVSLAHDSIKKESRVVEYMDQYKENGSKSIAKGTVFNGSLENGKLLPFSGSNYQYFDTVSYLLGRAFVHENVKKCLLASYQNLEPIFPKHRFILMESANECGGKLAPHRTHQNGLSVDFMMPLLQNGEEYSGVDGLGTSHYFMEFDDRGRYSMDTTVAVNFEMVARHILELEKEAKTIGLKVEKVIIKLEFKDELFASIYGDELRKRGIYFAKQLTPLVNNLHDDHYHVDFSLTH
jgi:penicillin-insensitive murein DD-endopeptidase